MLHIYLLISFVLGYLNLFILLFILSFFVLHLYFWPCKYIKNYDYISIESMVNFVLEFMSFFNTFIWINLFVYINTNFFLFFVLMFVLLYLIYMFSNYLLWFFLIFCWFDFNDLKENWHIHLFKISVDFDLMKCELVLNIF